MSRPGVEVTSAAAAPPLGVPTDTSVGFIVSEAYMGPIDAPTRITSLDEFTDTYGDAIPGCWGYNSVDTFFHEGGTSLYFQRLADSTAAAATKTASTIITGGGTVDAANPGAWGNTAVLDVVPTPGTEAPPANGDDGNGTQTQEVSDLLTFAVDTGPTFMATVTVNGRVQQTSKPLVSGQDLADFLATGGYLRLNGFTAANLVKAGQVVLAGGADGALPVTDNAQLVTALAAIPPELGPGQLLAPGRTAYLDQAAVLASAAETNRVALLDAAGPTDDANTCASASLALRGADQDRYGSMWAPWAVIPGTTSGTTRQVPWSAVQAGLCARNDLSGNPNQAAAGSWGASNYAIGLTQAFSADDCEYLLYAGCDTARTVYGAVEAYAFRTLVDPDGLRQQWIELNHARLNMAIVAESESVGQDYVFAQIDGRGQTIAAFGGALTGMLKEFYDDGALYSDPGTDDPTTAFQVNVGPAVNTPDKLADGVLSAVLTVRMSPQAELVQIAIVKQAITVSLV